MVGFDEGQFHLNTTAVLTDSGTEGISCGFSDFVGILASLFNSGMLFAKNFHLVGGGASLE
jgi:hypothetical protein